MSYINKYSFLEGPEVYSGELEGKQNESSKKRIQEKSEPSFYDGNVHTNSDEV